MNQPKRKRGRPKGSTTKDTPVVEIQKTECPKCGSTNRTPYQNTITKELGAKKVTWRTCRCKDCGQCRRDKEIQDLI